MHMPERLDIWRQLNIATSFTQQTPESKDCLAWAERCGLGEKLRTQVDTNNIVDSVTFHRLSCSEYTPHLPKHTCPRAKERIGTPHIHM